MFAAERNADDIDRIRREIERTLNAFQTQQYWNLPFAPEGNRQ